MKALSQQSTVDSSYQSLFSSLRKKKIGTIFKILLEKYYLFYK